MQITAIEIWTVVVPTIPGRVHSPSIISETGWDQIPKQIIRLKTDSELVGVGETQRGVALDEVRLGAQKLLGRNPETLTLQNIYEAPTTGDETSLHIGDGPAYDAFEMAVFDLVGKMHGVPVHALLGGAIRERVQADYWMGQQTPADSQRTVERALSLGFKGVKIKCQLEDQMVERLKAILDVAGPDFKVTVDPNERFYTAPQTIDLAHQLAALGNVEVFEDPIPKSDLAGYIEIHEAIRIPLAMHLSDGPAIVRGLKAGVLDCVNLNGGLVGFQHNAVVAAAGGLQCWHGSGNDLGIMETSYIHAAAAAPNCTMASDFVGGWTRVDDLIVDPVPFEDGFTPTPTQPGLGCILDETALQRYTKAYEQIQR
ncbi:MAG: mandelate racemase/muconate lactonizing enzyme family protein [Chloroflexota bacterium]